MNLIFTIYYRYLKSISLVLLMLIWMSNDVRSNEIFIISYDIHQSFNEEIEKYLKDNRFEKERVYYDPISQTDIETYIYPFVKLTSSTTLVAVSRIPGLESYTYLLLVNNSNKISIIDTIGPFIDNVPREVQKIHKMNGVEFLLKLDLPQSGFENDSVTRIESIDICKKRGELGKIDKYLCK